MRRRPLLLALTAAPAALACEAPLRAGVSLLGWGVFEEAGQLRGFVIDLLRRLSEETGCALQPSLRPRARVMLDFQNGEVDVVTSSLRNPDRDLAGDFEPYAYSGYELLMAPALAPRVHSLASLERIPALKLGLVRGVQLPGSVGAVFERLAAQGRIEWAPDFSNLALRMVRERVPVAVFPTAVHLRLSHEGALPAQLVAKPLPESPPQPIGLYVSRRVAEARREALLLALRRLVRSGEVQRLYARYLGEAATQRMFDAGRAAAGA